MARQRGRTWAPGPVCCQSGPWLTGVSHLHLGHRAQWLGQVLGMAVEARITDGSGHTPWGQHLPTIAQAATLSRRFHRGGRDQTCLPWGRKGSQACRSGVADEKRSTTPFLTHF